MKTVITCLVVIFCSAICLAEGTYTVSQIEDIDPAKSFLDVKKITVTKETETQADRQKEVICFAVGDGQYKITDTKELILLLLKIVTENQAKP